MASRFSRLNGDTDKDLQRVTGMLNDDSKVQRAFVKGLERGGSRLQGVMTVSPPFASPPRWEKRVLELLPWTKESGKALADWIGTGRLCPLPCERKASLAAFFLLQITDNAAPRCHCFHCGS